MKTSQQPVPMPNQPSPFVYRTKSRPVRTYQYYIQLTAGSYQFFGPFQTEAGAYSKIRKMKAVGAKVVRVREK